MRNLEQECRIRTKTFVEISVQKFQNIVKNEIQIDLCIYA